MTLRFRRSMLLIPTTLLAAFLTGCGGNNITTPSSPSPPPVASFAGSWSGTYTASNCGHTGDWPSGLCDELSGALPVTLTLTQTGSSVTGTLTQHQIVTSVTGSVSASGHLLLNGSTSMTDTGLGTVIFTIVGWDTQLNGNSMTGSWNEHVTSSAVAGFVQWIDTIDSVVKASANQATASSEVHGQPGGSLGELLGLTRSDGN